jgi:hypothetical protein
MKKTIILVFFASLFTIATAQNHGPVLPTEKTIADQVKAHGPVDCTINRVWTFEFHKGTSTGDFTAKAYTEAWGQAGTGYVVVSYAIHIDGQNVSVDGPRDVQVKDTP